MTGFKRFMRELYELTFGREKAKEKQSEERIKWYTEKKENEFSPGKIIDAGGLWNYDLGVIVSNEEYNRGKQQLDTNFKPVPDEYWLIFYQKIGGGYETLNISFNFPKVYFTPQEAIQAIKNCQEALRQEVNNLDVIVNELAKKFLT